MQFLFAVFCSVVYGLLMRLVFGFYSDLWQVMSIAFIFVVPLGIGALTVRFSEPQRIHSRLYCFFAPWLSSLALLIVTILLSIEGIICWVMAYPVFGIISGIGGLFMRRYLLGRAREEQKDLEDRALDAGDDFRNKGNLQVSLLLVLPFLVAEVERHIEFAPQTLSAYTSLDMAAPDTLIWHNVTRMHTISPAEDHSRLTRWMGLPRPLRAALDTLAVGGQREAVFDRGLVFHEKVFEYEPLREMAFTIRVNADEIPPTTMDEHIVIGGQYFDVIDGRYRLEPLGEGRCRLHLSSRFRVSTSFNFYAGLWAQWIMSDIQDNLLQVIRGRVEGIGN